MPEILTCRDHTRGPTSPSQSSLHWYQHHLDSSQEAPPGGKHRLLKALQGTPNLLKQFCTILEDVLEENLEKKEVKRVVQGISTGTHRRVQALVRCQQEQKDEKFPALLHLRYELIRTMMGTVKRPSRALPRQLSIIPGIPRDKDCSRKFQAFTWQSENKSEAGGFGKSLETEKGSSVRCPGDRAGGPG
ncbi:hypothetical protein BTVI_140578 [Pitangus sulphuratus]|nr:hypothetical protein BTVI_140578 [Pitangus sulphuratus]